MIDNSNIHFEHQVELGVRNDVQIGMHTSEHRWMKMLRKFRLVPTFIAGGWARQCILVYVHEASFGTIQKDNVLVSDNYQESLEFSL